MKKTCLFCLSLVLLVCAGAYAQKKKNRFRYRADKLTNGRKEGIRYKKLIGNVVFTQKNTTVYCDTSYYYAHNNTMKAFGHVKIVDDSVHITSQKLIYKGNENLALLREEVVYQKGTKTLYTDVLDYDMMNEVSKFSHQGKLVDERNTLTSQSGVFYGRSSQAFFHTRVLLVSPDFDLKTDTLEYSSMTKIAFSKGPTYIVNKEGTTVHADGGKFRTAQEQTTFEEGTIETKNYTITGDEIFLDDQKQFYTAKGHVVMTAKKDDVLIFGDQMVYHKHTGISKVYGRPLMKRILEMDTMYLSADTLVSLENADKDKERILAYPDVLIYKKNMQGKCDSSAYFLADSTIHLYFDPVIWNKSSQTVADSIDLTFEKRILKTMTLKKQAFLISIDLLGQYNQVKGRRMIGDFNKYGDLQLMNVEGNGESHYFLLKGDSVMVGMNKIFCSSMRIRFKDNIMQNVSFYVRPEAKFIPPHELKKTDMYLGDFKWRASERPKLYDVATYYATPEQLERIKARKEKLRLEKKNKLRQQSAEGQEASKPSDHSTKKIHLEGHTHTKVEEQ